MTRKGRDLEKVISLLEGAFKQSSIQLRSPDFLPDKDTGVLREVDISLRGQVGSSNILAIIECRDRDAPQDVTWIEQVICKRSSVNADKALAVSSSKFSKPARAKAERNSIELRTLDELDPRDVTDWFVKCPFVLIHRLHLKTMSANFYPENPDGMEIEANLPIFRRKIDKSWVSFNEILQNGLHSIPIEKLYTDVPLNGSEIRRNMTFNYPNEQDRFQISTKSGDVDIESLVVDTILWITDEEVPPTSIKAYRDKERDIAKIQDFRFNINNIEYALCFHRSEIDGTKNVSLMRDVEPNDKESNRDIMH